MTERTAIRADITTLDVDAIVNAANTRLRHGGGLAAAIARAAGPIVQEQSDDWVREHGPLRPGLAAVTDAGALPARHVIHVAGPRFSEEQNNAGLLSQAVEAALIAATEHDCSSLALPAISAGIYGYPLDEATDVIVGTTWRWTTSNPGAVESILFVGFDDPVRDAFDRALTTRRRAET